MTFFILILFSSPWIKEKRTRLYAQLPVSPTYSGVARFLIFLIYWLFFTLLFSLYQYLSKYFIFDRATLFSLVAQTGVAFIIYSIAFLGKNFLYRFSNEIILLKLSKRNLFMITLIFIGIFVAFISVAAIVHTYQNQYPLGQFNRNLFVFLYRTTIGVSLLGILGLGLTVWEIFTYQNRKSFIE